MNSTKAYSYISYLLVDGVAKLGPFVVLLYLGKNSNIEDVSLLESYVIYSNLFVNVLTLGQNGVYIANLYDGQRNSYNLKAVMVSHLVGLILAIFIGKIEVIYAILFSLLSFVYNLTQTFENIHGAPHLQRRRDIIYSVLFVIITMILSAYLSSSYLLRVLPVLLSLFVVVILTTSKKAFKSLRNFSRRISTFSGETWLIVAIALFQWYVVYADKLLLRSWGKSVGTADYFMLTSCMTIQLLISLAILKVVRRDLLKLETEAVLRRFKWYSIVSVISGFLCFSFAVLYLSNTMLIGEYWSLLPLYFSISIFYFMYSLFLRANTQKSYSKITFVMLVLFLIFSSFSLVMKNINVFHLANTVLYLIMTTILFVNTQYYDTISS